MQHHEEQTMEQIVCSLRAEVDQKLHDQEVRWLNDLQAHEDRRQAQQSEIQALKQKVNKGMYTLVLKTSSSTLLTSKSLALTDLWLWWGF